MNEKAAQEYVGFCSGVPSLSWLAKSDEEAFAGIRARVADVVPDMEHNRSSRSGRRVCCMQKQRSSQSPAKNDSLYICSDIIST